MNPKLRYIFKRLVSVYTLLKMCLTKQFSINYVTNVNINYNTNVRPSSRQYDRTAVCELSHHLICKKQEIILQKGE